MRGLLATFVLWVLWVLCAPALARVTDVETGKLVSAAIERGGGAVALRKFQNLSWTGEAKVYVQGKPRVIGVETQVMPSGVVRSKSWLKDKGHASDQMMEMSPTSGLLTREGLTKPMPPEIFEHERVQYSLYQLLRLVILLDKPVEVSMAPAEASGLRGLRVARPGLPEAIVWLDATHRPVRIDTRVPDPEGEGMIDQRMMLSGEIVSHGVAWPKTIHITWDGKPYFDLELTSFVADPL